MSSLSCRKISSSGIRRGILTVAEADEMKESLERLRFRMMFGSFRELL